MPVLSTKLWMFTLGFLPKARRAKTLEAVQAMERSALAARPLRALTQCYEEGIFATGSSEENLFIYFKKKNGFAFIHL